MPSQCFLSIIIPAYNEEERLKQSLPDLKEFLKQQSFIWELILVDDGSSDKTKDAHTSFFTDEEDVKVIHIPANRGKGFAVRKGMLASKGEIVLISDADFSTPLTEWSKLYQTLQQGYDIAIGSRSLAESDVIIRQAWYREGMGRIFNWMVRLLVLDGFVDTQCGFKCFRREAVLPVFEKMVIDRFSFDVEMLFVAQKHGLAIKEVPVKWKNVLFSRVRIIADSVTMLRDLLRIRFNSMLGTYD